VNPVETPRNSSKFGQITTYTVKWPLLRHEIKDKEQYTMPAKTLRIATRKSPLALWQAHYVKTVLEKTHSDLNVELLAMSTRGDKILDTPLAKVGGKGLFVKELEHAMLEDRADIAVNFLKDLVWRSSANAKTPPMPLSLTTMKK
jgi:DUF971 family protein